MRFLNRWGLAALLACSALSSASAQTAQDMFAGTERAGFPVTLASGKVVWVPALTCTDTSGAYTGCTGSGGAGGGTSQTATANAPTYTEGSTTNPLSSDLAGNTRVRALGSGTVGAAAPTTVLQIGGTDGTNLRAFSTDTAGRQNVNINGTVPVNNTQVGGVAIAAGSGASNTGTQRVVLSTDSFASAYGAVTTAAPAYTTGTVNSFSLTTAGDLRTVVSNTTRAIDQTTPGTTNGVVVNSSALPAGAATAANQPSVATNAATAPTTGTMPLGLANSSAPAAATPGNAVRAWYNPYGAANVGLTGTGGSAITDGVPTNGQSLFRGIYTVSQNMNYNGTQEVLAAGDTTGTWAGGHANMASGQVSVTTAATLIAAARTGRQKIIITSAGTNLCYYGGSGVTTTTGFTTFSTAAGATVTLDTASAVYGICAAATNHSFVEEY